MHHTVAIYRKLGVRGRTEAATWALKRGITKAE
jgi:DNA-binding NarL/FixJ family response regulator